MPARSESKVPRLRPIGPRPASQSQLCEALGLAGGALVFDGHGWSSPSQVDPAEPSAVSCPTSGRCVVVDAQGGTVTYDGTSWSARVVIDPISAPWVGEGTR